jgi:hypothetical protein
MADLLGLLTGGLTAGTNVANARSEGRAIKRDREQADLLAELERQRRAEQDKQATYSRDLQNRNVLDQIRERSEAPVVAPPKPDYEFHDGQRVDMGTGTATPIQGYTPPQKPAPAGSGTPQRGTPEYLQMLKDEAAARATGGGGERGAQLPAPAIEKMIELDDLIGMTKRARVSLGEAVRDGKNVTGRVGGILPVANWIRNAPLVRQGGDAGTAVRSELANVSSTIMKLRSGAAVSDQEFARLEPFLASDDDDESVAMIKLRKLSAALEEMKRIRLENYQRYGKPGAQGIETISDDDGESVTTSTGRTFTRVNP